MVLKYRTVHVIVFNITRHTYKLIIIKRPARDACLCMGELQAPATPAAPPAPHFVFLITL